MKKLLLPLISILSFGIILSSCEKLDTSDPILIAPDFINYVTTVNIVTDPSEEASEIVDLSLDNTLVTVTGADADKVKDPAGGKNFKILGGAVQLIVDPNATFDASNEINVNLTVAPSGYLKRIIPVKFTKDQNVNSFTISLLKESNTYEGVKLVNGASRTINATGLTSALDVTASNGTGGVTTKITVPAGIKMKDASGAVISGTLASKVISFNDFGDATSFFPGGLNQSNIVFAGGAVDEGTFEPAGFASVGMTVGGTTVKTFEGGKVTVKMTLSNQNYNPTTDKPYAAGDDIDISSYDTEKGQWKFESVGKVQKDIDNTLFVSFETSHLSFFNLAKLSKGKAKKCATNSTLTFNWSSNKESIKAYLHISNTSRFGTSTKTIQIKKGEAITLISPPNFKSRILLISEEKTLLDKTYANLCSNITETIDVPGGNPEVTLRYGRFCPNISDVNFLPPLGTVVYYREQGAKNYKLLHIVDKDNRLVQYIKTDLLQVGKTYDFKVVSANLTRTVTHAITSTNMTFSNIVVPSTCNQLAK